MANYCRTRAKSIILVNQESHNGMTRNTVLRRTSSPIKDPYAKEVKPDSHPATALRSQNKLHVATWNVRTMYQSGKLENLKRGRRIEGERNGYQ